MEKESGRNEAHHPKRVECEISPVYGGGSHLSRPPA